MLVAQITATMCLLLAVVALSIMFWLCQKVDRAAGKIIRTVLPLACILAGKFTISFSHPFMHTYLYVYIYSYVYKLSVHMSPKLAGVAFFEFG